MTTRFWAKVDRRAAKECWPWKAGRDAYGYGVIDQMHASRAAWEITRGPIPEGLDVLHRCDFPPCVNPDHLFLGTQADNVRDMDTKGRRRSLIGNDNGRAKLDPETVRAIRSALTSGETRASIARRLVVSWPTIGNIAKGRTWTHVK